MTISRFLRFGVVLFATVALLFSASISEASVRKHALPKAVRAVVKVSVKTAVVAPKIMAVAFKDTIGMVLFVGEAGVDVVHAGTTALSKVGSMELKKNPFAVVDKGVAYVDTGLEKGYLFFFSAQI